MSAEPESVILRSLRDMRAEIGDMRSEMAIKSDVANLRSDLHSEMTSLRADVAARAGWSSTSTSTVPTRTETPALVKDS